MLKNKFSTSDLRTIWFRWSFFPCRCCCRCCRCRRCRCCRGGCCDCRSSSCCCWCIRFVVAFRFRFLIDKIIIRLKKICKFIKQKTKYKKFHFYIRCFDFFFFLFVFIIVVVVNSIIWTTLKSIFHERKITK